MPISRWFLHRRWLTLTVVATSTFAGVAELSRGNSAAQLNATLTLVVLCTLATAWVALDERWHALNNAQLLTILIVFRVAAFFVEPLLEDDHFRYLWDGFIGATTGQPFAHAPSHYFQNATVPSAMQALLSGINNPEIPTIYGPLLQAIFALGFVVAPAELWPLKCVLLLAEIAMLSMLRRSGVSPRWLMLWVLHPLIVKESAVTAHPDVLVGVLLLAAVLCWRNARASSAAAFAAAAVAVKVSAVIALPIFWVTREGRFSVRGFVTSVVALSVFYGPFWIASSGTEGRALGVFGQLWTFNPLVFRAVSLVLNDGAARAVVALIFISAWLFFFGRWIAALRAANDSTAVNVDSASPTPPIIMMFTVLLLLSPAMNPWYWLWVLPLVLWTLSTQSKCASSERNAAIIACAAATVSLLAYSHVAEQVIAGSAITTFAVPLWATAVQFGIIATALIYVFKRASRTKFF
jgi:alpha-1,6-mannosyltransferase